MQKFIQLPILFLFLPGFTFYIPGLNVYSFFFISLYIALFLIFYTNKTYMLRRTKLFMRRTPLRYMIYFLLFVSVDSIVLSFTGINSIASIIKTIILRIFLCIIPVLLYFSCIIGKYITLKNFMKLFMLLFWLSMFMGIVAYMGRLYNLSFINMFFEFLNNARILECSKMNMPETTAEMYFLESKRLCCFFEEPGHLGQFIFLFLPFVYTLVTIKSKFYQNIFFNTLFKFTIIPLVWLNLILTKSPIMLVFSLIITLLYFYNDIIKFSKKYIIYIITLSFASILLISQDYSTFNIDFTDTYLMRVVNVISNLNSFEQFMTIEPSLATRVVSYINEFRLFMLHPFTGVGIGYVGYHMYSMYLTSPVPLTYEIINKTKLVMSGGTAFANGGLTYMTLAENGLFAYLILIYFYFKLYKYNINILKSISNKYFEFYIAESLKFSIVCIGILSFYNLSIKNVYMYIIIVLVIHCNYYAKQKMMKERYGK